MSAVLVALGGAAGSVLRFWMSGVAQRAVPATGTLSLFPVGTLIVNVLGCIVVGALVEIGDRRGPLTPEVRALLIVGFLGGFTTFSAFANETVTVWRSGATGATLVSFLNVVMSVALCLAGVVLGRGAVAALVK